MIYLLLGGLALAGYFWLRRRAPGLKRREWRIVLGVAALVAFTAAAWTGVRGSWALTLALVVLGLWLAGSARAAASPPSPRSPPATRVSEAEARRILGVGEAATPEEIQAAYARLIRAVHPDAGGTEGLAAQLNAARDRLLRK